MKITKTQLRQIIREEIEKVNELGGVYGGRAYSDSPYKGAQSARSWNKGAKERYNKLASAKMRPEDLTALANEELKKVFPNLTFGSLAKKHRDLILHFADKDAGYRNTDPDVMRQKFKELFSGERRSSPYSNSDALLDALKSYGK